MLRYLLLAGIIAAPYPAYCQNAFSGDVSTATAKSGSAPSVVARSLAKRFEDQFNVLDYGAKCDGSSNDTAAFQVAEEAARFSSAGGGTVYVPSGTCVLTGTVYTNARAVWDLAAGVNLPGGGLLYGSTDEGANFGTSGRSIMAVGRDGGIDNAIFASFVSGGTTGGAYQKNGVYARVLQADVSASNQDKDVVAVFGHGDVSAGNSNGRVWGGDFTVRIPSGSSGYAVGTEVGVENDTGKSAPFGSIGSILGISIFASGSAPSTAGVYVGNAGQPFLNGILMYDNAALLDAFSVHRSDGSDSTLASISHTGNATFQGIQLAPTAVGSVVKYAIQAQGSVGGSHYMTTDGKTFSATNCPFVPRGVAATSSILVVGRQPSTGQSASWLLTGGLFASANSSGSTYYQGPGSTGAAPLFVTGSSAANASARVGYDAGSGCILITATSPDGNPWDLEGSIELSAVK